MQRLYKPMDYQQHARRVSGELVQVGLEAGGRFRLRVASGSMRPSLRVGDDLIVNQKDWRALRPGDIVLCRIGESLVAHRLIWIRAQRGSAYLMMKGDTAPQFDPAVGLDAYMGVVTRIERAGQVVSLESTWSRVAARAHLLVSLARVVLHRVWQALGRA